MTSLIIVALTATGFRNSERLIDEQINIALDTRDSLVNQREVLKVTFFVLKVSEISSTFFCYV
jgi:hypothetical protein